MLARVTLRAGAYCAASRPPPHSNRADWRSAGGAMNEYDHGRHRTARSGADHGLSRRGFLLAGASGIAALAAGDRALAQEEPGVTRPLRGRVLLRGGTVLTLDRALGDFERA